VALEINFAGTNKSIYKVNKLSTSYSIARGTQKKKDSFVLR